MATVYSCRTTLEETMFPVRLAFCVCPPGLMNSPREAASWSVPAGFQYLSSHGQNQLRLHFPFCHHSFGKWLYLLITDLILTTQQKSTANLCGGSSELGHRDKD